jgi:hypothetical protein
VNHGELNTQMQELLSAITARALYYNYDEYKKFPRKSSFFSLITDLSFGMSSNSLRTDMNSLYHLINKEKKGKNWENSL